MSHILMPLQFPNSSDHRSFSCAHRLNLKSLVAEVSLLGNEGRATLKPPWKPAISSDCIERFLLVNHSGLFCIGIAHSDSRAARGEPVILAWLLNTNTSINEFDDARSDGVPFLCTPWTKDSALQHTKHIYRQANLNSKQDFNRSSGRLARLIEHPSGWCDKLDGSLQSKLFDSFAGMWLCRSM